MVNPGTSIICVYMNEMLESLLYFTEIYIYNNNNKQSTLLQLTKALVCWNLGHTQVHKCISPSKEGTSGS